MSAPKATVICAVWSQDPNREGLLFGHAQNLDSQTVPIERIYVFEDGDMPPDGLAGEHHVSAGQLSIYQAWNVALAQVKTPYVLNLNLDDRLAPDAIAKLEWAADKGADLVCGDWRICYSQAATDAVEPVSPIDSLPVVHGWPLQHGTVSRLGSADVRDTYGPACLWRMSLHHELPRYPWRFDDGTLVKGCGDWLFWRELRKRKKTIARLPSIIGRYHSHPRDQAEFRFQGQDDLARGTSCCCQP